MIAPEDLALATSLYLEFDTDKWDIKSKYFEELNAIADVLLRDPGSTARIEGHADKRRTSVYKHNMELSEKRANSVMEYLHSRGVERERMKAYGYGYSRPVAENDPITGNQLNRRVEINIRKGSEQNDV
ncbi:MAG: OmpA family protein [Lentisphaerae bacterium]|nr:OmpA family protein [Lentisphaerota bacterium]